MLQLKNIVKSYTTGDFTQVALDGVNLNFRKSEFVAILGPSGSGKTTCLNVIGGLDQYDNGDLVINGQSTKGYKSSDWDAYRNNSVGFIFQSYNLITHLSIVDNVELGMTLSGVAKGVKHKRALEALQRVGLGEHVHKKPNQLSGGQMQRVAIARALANDPDIILADEPTGALDTATSIQIMNLIKEIAKDKLVVMVTHNPELAKNYADRIVEFRDGKVIADSNPMEEQEKDHDYTLKKTSMNFFTALKLSGKNIATKKWRTALTAFASSIGIIGIALVLSLSNGFDNQIDNFENTTLSGFPIMVTQTTEEIDREAMKEQRNDALGLTENKDKYPDETYVIPYDSSTLSTVHTNVFTDEYVDYIEAMDATLLSGISYMRQVNMNLLKSDGVTASNVNTSLVNLSAYPTNMNPESKGYLESSYDLLAGSYPTQMNDIVLVVDSYNKVDMNILQALGMNFEAENIRFEDILKYQYKVILNNNYYVRNGDLFGVNGVAGNMIDVYNNADAITLNIVGIIRANEDTKMAILTPGIAYSDELSSYFIQDAQNSEIVKAQEAAEFNVLTGEAFDTLATSNTRMTGSMSSWMGGGNAVITKESILSLLGEDATPYLITIYPRDFKAKEGVLDYLNEWNEEKEEVDTVIYTDMASTFTDLVGGIMDAITLVLVAFAAISLVVSLIMIGIITYISVLERTKEIGVLRALGARKKDITRVFNAETFITGTCSGLLGILIAFLLVFPINAVILKVTDLENVAKLNPVHAILLVVVSVSLTMLGGMIPARIAAKKDPVEALRSE